LSEISNIAIAFSYQGFYDPKYAPILLTPETVENIHHKGGTILSSSRGGFEMDKLQDFIRAKKIKQLYSKSIK